MTSPTDTPADQTSDLANPDPIGANTYSTGGGGVTFAQRVATVYLASMLTRSRRAETNELAIRSVSFQTGPAHPVDDLLIAAGEPDNTFELAIACRATPHFVPSNTATVKLLKSLLDETTAHPDVHVAIAVAGWKNEWQQVATLCYKARDIADPAVFHDASKVDRRWNHDERKRYVYLRQMVEKALDGTPSVSDVVHATWGLLRRLRVIGFHVQSPNESDWTAIATTLDLVAAKGSDGLQVRDRLADKSAGWDSQGAVVDLNMVRVATHILLDAPATRTKHAWEMLNLQRAQAYTVRSSLGSDPETGEAFALSFTERRANVVAEILNAGNESTLVVVSGASGTGKSSLVLSAITELESSHQDGFEAIVVNFRELPNTSLEITHILGASIADVAAELSAPARVLVVDAADAAFERSAGLLRDLVTAAIGAGLGVIAVSAEPAAEFVREQLSHASSQPIRAVDITALDDQEVAQVAERFPQLRGILTNLAEESILRRLVVLDLLSRTGVTLDGPMSEWECLQLIWAHVIRANGRNNSGSPQAREDTLLALAAAALASLDTPLPPGTLDPAAVDALRDDHLLAPANAYRPGAQFAHDEVRRYATAIHLIQAGDIPAALQSAGVPRWALSAATLAVKGQLVDPDRRPETTFANVVAGFNAIATSDGKRWADVAVEAVLETPKAYDCLKTAIETSAIELPDVLRVAQQRCTVNGLIHPMLGAPIARILIDHDEPWDISKPAFEVLTSWLQALVVTGEPAGHDLRQTLRTRLLAHWAKYPRKEDTGEGSVLRHFGGRQRRRRTLRDYEVTKDEFVETLALLGLDIDTDISACLRALAEDAPAFLAPAVDSALSARALVQHDPELLATLAEAYYIDEDADGSWGLRDDGIRGHEGRWTSFGPPTAAYWFGAFWQLFNAAHITTSVRVLNNILNYATKERAESARRRHWTDPAETGDSHDEPAGIVLNLTGEARNYLGDGQVWTWYRGTSGGPDPAMSALQAMEHFVEILIKADISTQVIAERLLQGCENLAVPGLLYGILARHIERAGTQLDPFLAAPAIWFLESSRVTSEHYGFRASDEGLAHPERRKWTAREVAVRLVANGDEERRTQLAAVGEDLVAEGERQGIEGDRVLNWAANLDVGSFKVTQEGDDLYLHVVPPPEVVSANAEIMAQQQQASTVMRLQNRYWGSAKYDNDYVEPTVDEIAADLATAQELLNTELQPLHTPPGDAVAQVVRAAIGQAFHGGPDALGSHGSFVIQFVMTVASSFANQEDPVEDHQFFDLGADRAAAQALPALLAPALAAALQQAGVTPDQVVQTAFAIAAKAPAETRLYLARGCDPIWNSPCSGNAPCIHQTALAWTIETARTAEIGPWDFEAQHSPRVRIEGDLVTRLQELDGELIAVHVLDPALRALGVAATTSHCATSEARTLLADLLAVQRTAMVRHEAKGYTADDRGMHTLVAARALLQGYAESANPDPTFEHLDVLRTDAGLMSGFLHGLAGAGAENEVLAQAARDIWPSLVAHALEYAGNDPNVYKERTWGAWAAAGLLPSPLSWSQGMYNEVAKTSIDWVDPDRLVGLVDPWLAIAKGNVMCVDALIRILRKLPESQQTTNGLTWVSELCIQEGRVTVTRSTASNEWLKEVRIIAEEHGRLPQWQALVDALVVAGNTELAPYST